MELPFVSGTVEALGRCFASDVNAFPRLAPWASMLRRYAAAEKRDYTIDSAVVAVRWIWRVRMRSGVRP
jgi:hypothetical protein